MAETSVESELGEYFIGGSSAGSEMVGWDYSNVRSMHYEFHTPAGSSYSKFKFYGPPAVLKSGEPGNQEIELRFAISSSYGYWTGASGQPSGSKVFNSEAWNEMSTSLDGDTTYYITIFPGTTYGSTNYFGLYYPFGYNNPRSEDWVTVYLTEDSGGGGGGGGQSYTNCSAPTSVTLGPPNIAAPGTSSTLRWSGARAGQGMSIYGYDVYRSTSASGTFSYLGRSYGNSRSVSASSNRGETYYYRVKTIGTVSGYDSNLSTASPGLKSNTLPGEPTVSVDTTVVPSTGGDVTFTVTPGSDADGQTLTLAYSTSLDPMAEITTFTSPLTITVTEPTTFYFYTYDQLEYSRYVSQGIGLNDRPEIDGVSHSTLGNYFALGSNGVAGYQLYYASNITPTITTNKTGTVLTRIEYYTSNNTTAWPSTPPESYGYRDIEIPITSTINASLGLLNIHQYITLEDTNIHWRLRLQLFDGGEYSEFAYYPADSYYYCIARPSDVLAQYNQFANSNITNTIAGQMWRNVRLKLYNDTSVTIPSATAVANNVTFTGTVTTSIGGTNNEYRYLDITFPDGILSGATITIGATMKDSGNFGKTSYATMVETKTPILTTLSHGAGIIKPFTQTGSFEIVTVWPFGLYEHIDATTLAAYNCDRTAANVIKLIYSSSSVGDGANRVVKTLTWDKSGDNLVTTMDRSEAYDWDHTIGISVYDGSQTYYCRIEITNLFGKVISTPWVSRVFNFAEPIQSSEILSVDWSLDKLNWSALGNRAIQEGVYIRLNCTFSLFSTDEIEVSVLLKNSSGERSVTCYESGSEANPRLTPITYANTELLRATGRTPVSNTRSYVFYVNTEIADTTDRLWRLQFKNSGYTTLSSYFSTPVIRHCQPNLVLIDCDSDENYELTYIYTMTDPGYDTTVQDNTIVNYLSDGTTRMASTPISSTLGRNITGTLQATVTGWEVKAISVEMVTTVVGLYSHTKTFFSVPVLVFQMTPTVAYRKNQLGVNSATLDTHAIVDIHQADERNTVLIQGFTTDFIPAKFEVDVTTGKINYYTHDITHDVDVLQHSIDLLNGRLT